MRYKRAQSIAINRCIHEANIANFTQQGALDYIRDKTGITLGLTSYIERKRQLRIHAIKTWTHYRKDDYALRLEFLKRIHTVELVAEAAARKMIEFDTDNPKTFFHWKSAAYALMEANKQLTDLQLLLPEIDAIGHNNEHLETENPAIPRTSSNPEAIF